MNDIRPKRNHFPTTFPVKILRLPITFKTIESDSIKIPLSWIQRLKKKNAYTQETIQLLHLKL